MKIKLACPEAYHGQMMRVYCKKTNDFCLCQYFRNCKGWWENSPSAKDCKLRGQNK